MKRKVNRGVILKVSMVCKYATITKRLRFCSPLRIKLFENQFWARMKPQTSFWLTERSRSLSSWPFSVKNIIFCMERYLFAILLEWLIKGHCQVDHFLVKYLFHTWKGLLGGFPLKWLGENQTDLFKNQSFKKKCPIIFFTDHKNRLLTSRPISGKM